MHLLRLSALGGREAGTRGPRRPRFPLPDPPGQHNPWCTQSVPTASAATIFGRGHRNMRKASRRKRSGSPCSPHSPSNFEMMCAVTLAAINVKPDVSNPYEFRGRYRRPQLSPQSAAPPVKNEPVKKPVGPNNTVDTKGTCQVQTPVPPHDHQHASHAHPCIHALIGTLTSPLARPAPCHPALPRSAPPRAGRVVPASTY